MIPLLTIIPGFGGSEVVMKFTQTYGVKPPNPRNSEPKYLQFTGQKTCCHRFSFNSRSNLGWIPDDSRSTNETLAKKLLEIDEGSLGWGLQLRRTGTSDRIAMGGNSSPSNGAVNIVYTKKDFHLACKNQPQWSTLKWTYHYHLCILDLRYFRV
jgi:hypothetical protein